MLKTLVSDRKFLSLLILCLLIKLFSFHQAWVERYYTYGFYPFYSRVLRLLFGWIPFSVGDLLYVAGLIWILIRIIQCFRLVRKKGMKEVLNWKSALVIGRIALWIYLVFNVSWGLNYNRSGIASQLQLKVTPYSRQELLSLTLQLQQKLNAAALLIDTIKRQQLDDNQFLFQEGIKGYKNIQPQYPFLSYPSPSTKASLLSGIGHYFGFSGYINPITNEAQINTAEPVFTKPFVIGHEIAHQVGYGKENEASFVSYLVNKNSGNVDFRYSVYYELFFDALYEYRAARDSVSMSLLLKNMERRVRQDWWDEIVFRQKRKNKMQPYVSDFYNSYLKMNNQPHGLATYNEVIAWLIAYLKKFGPESL